MESGHECWTVDDDDAAVGGNDTDDEEHRLGSCLQRSTVAWLSSVLNPDWSKRSEQFMDYNRILANSSNHNHTVNRLPCAFCKCTVEQKQYTVQRNEMNSKIQCRTESDCSRVSALIKQARLFYAY